MLGKKARGKLLVVDDDPDILDSISNYLELEGFEVLRASGGNAAIEMSKSGVDVIVLDIMMPEVDGFQVVEHLKRTTETAQIPVIFLTAKSTDQDVLRGWQKGAALYITKPFNFPDLTKALEHILAEEKKRASQKRIFEI